ERVLPGVNCRDLRTLDVEPERLVRAARHFGTETVVAESGLHDLRDVATLAAAGDALALAGAALMRADTPAERPPAMVQAGSEAPLAAGGYALALVGTALMRADWPAERLRGMVTAGRRARCG